MKDNKKVDILLGILAIAGTIGSFLSWIMSGDYLSAITFLIIISISTLYLVIRHFKGNLDIIETPENIYALSIEILKKYTSKRLWTSAINAKNVPRKWFLKLKDKLESNPEIEHLRIVGINDVVDLENTITFLEEFKQLPNLLVSYVTIPVGADLFISDENELLIAFPEREAVPTLTACIRIRNKRIIRNMAAYYYSHLWRSAKPLKDKSGIKYDTIATLKASLISASPS